MSPNRELRSFVSCPAGDVSGLSTRGVNRFLGIPYAEPPVGNLRWRPPQRLEPFRDCFDAKAFGPGCVQNTPQISKTYTLPEYIEFSEDCLTLNIWAPENAKNAAVLFWIHGGSLVIGASCEPMYDGQALAERGIVVVSINYRLGVFGWLAHPELSEEQGATSGNYGLRDQICALEWVHENIAAFGGDPQNITIAGQSAGALSTVHLMVSPAATQLFAKAIAQSPYLFSMPALRRAVHGSPSAEQIGSDFAKAMEAPSLPDLRSLNAEQLMLGATRLRFPTSGVVDETLIPDQLITILDNGMQARVPVLTGFNEGEIRSLRALAPEAPAEQAEYISEIRRLYGDRAERFLDLYPPDNLEESILAATRDALYLYGSARLAEAQNALDQPSYLYLWDHGYPSADEGGARFSWERGAFCFWAAREHGPSLAEYSQYP